MGWLNLFREKKAQTDEQLLDMLAPGIGTSAGVTVSTEAALRVPTVAAAVRTIAEAVASLDVKVVEIGADGVEMNRPDHPAHKLLTGEANDWTSAFELVRSLMVDALCRDRGGLAWVNWIGGKPVEIIRYQPGTIGVERDTLTGEPSYRIQGQPTARQSILHVQGPFDKAPVTLAREAIGVAMVMEKHAARLFGSGARPSGVISSPKALGDEGAKRMLAGWRLAHEGAENSAKTAILWDGATWAQAQLSSVDAQFQELRLFQLQEIARAFNVPSIIIGDLIPMLFGHDLNDPIGTWDAAEDKSGGWHLTGKLLVDEVARAREVRSLVRSGAVKGLSVGFITKKAESRPGGGRLIKSLELFEVSLVTVGMHPGAKVVSAKSAVQALSLVAAINRATAQLGRN